MAANPDPHPRGLTFGTPIPVTGPRLAVAIATRNWTAAALSLLIATAELYDEEEADEHIQLQPIEAETRRPTR